MLRNVLRIAQNVINFGLKFKKVELVRIDSSIAAKAYRVKICDIETKTEFRLVTNLSADGDAGATDDEIKDIYRLRWGVELLWKSLKRHLKLNKLTTKNMNEITMQIHVILIVYLILHVVTKS